MLVRYYRSTQRFVSGGDRESDIFGYVRQAQQQHWDVLLRVAQNRVIVTPEGETAKVLTWARQLPAQTTQPLTWRGRDGQPSREVTLQVALSGVTWCAPRWGPERHQTPVQGWVVRCWATGADGQADLEWVLFTTLPVTTAAQARQMIQ